ncbi:hypothetical protein FHR32_005016 [Streptosporangium album]|uniref:Uncharacterized protein n=1 Tax=Streptosporangium album TaxID=47479 RepID=A0A7W7RYL2_9ACTN|nr:hypothetical protein [Streptosporangium album]
MAISVGSRRGADQTVGRKYTRSGGIDISRLYEEIEGGRL